MIKKLKELLEYLNEKGWPTPMLRDHGKASVSLTLLVLSSLFLMAGLLRELHPLLGGVNFWEALAWHITSAVLYYNRGAKISKSGFEITSDTSVSKPEIKE